MTNVRFITSFQKRAGSSHQFVAERTAPELRLTLLLIVLHVPLGVALYNSSALAVVHPFGVLLIGLYWALQKRVTLLKVGCVVAYIIGAEVLWRMAQAPIFWEFGKYGAAIVMLIALIRRGCFKIPTAPFLYLILLLPSCLLTILEFGLADAKDKLSFNMSGPLLITVSCWFFSHLRITTPQLKNLLLFLVIPLTSVAVVTLFFSVTTEDIQFNTESNFATSGGFGPNQVSAMLGLGAFLCLSGYLLFKNSLTENGYLALMATFFAAQSVLTFSRGGMYNAVGAVVVVVVIQMRSPLKNMGRLIPILALGLIFLGVVFPFLDGFTGGNLQTRFEEIDTTRRGDIIETDLQVFVENPIFGVGVGLSRNYREKLLGYGAAPHTEFSRTISEHGLFGLFALTALIFTAFTNLKRQKSTLGKAFVGGVMVWSVLFMFNSGMRLAAPSLIFGLSALTISALPAAKNNAIRRTLKTRRRFA